MNMIKIHFPHRACIYNRLSNEATDKIVESFVAGRSFVIRDANKGLTVTFNPSMIESIDVQPDKPTAFDSPNDPLTTVDVVL